LAIADLLWACPACGLDRGLRGPEEGACTGCGTRFDRVRGARIRARLPGGEERVRTAAAWVDELPDPASLLERGDPVRSAAVRARLVDRYEAVRDRGRYVNRIEVFGPEARGELVLGVESLRYTPGEGTPLLWPFEDLAAVQASSRTLQIRGRPHPLASFAFPDDSSFLWEQLLALALGEHYRSTGRGEVVELQPRIVTR
jgi:hypothetical protein